MASTPQKLKQLERATWLRWLAVFLALGATLAAVRWQAWQEVGAAQRLRLTDQVRSTGENLERQLQGVNAALRGLGGALVKDGRLSPPPQQTLSLLSDAMPGVRTLLVLDSEGRALASNRPELVGRDFSERAYFQRARADPRPEALQVSPPFRSVLGVYSINLTRSVVDGQGRWLGIVAATLDPSYFATLLRSGIYAEDMWAGVVHSEGRVLIYEPPRSVDENVDLRDQGVLFRQHLASGQITTVQKGLLRNLGEERLLAQHTVQPTSLAMDHGLVLGLSRDVQAMYAPWRESTLTYGMAWLLLALGSAVALRVLQVRHAEQLAERMRGEQSLAVTLHSIGDAVIATDPKGRITRLNATAERLTGWTAAQARGRSLAEVFRAVDSLTGEAMPDRVQQVLACGEPVALANGVELIARDGRRTQIADSAAPIRTPEGQILGVVMVFSDVTAQYQARRALEDRERQLSAIADALPGPVSRVDREGRYLFANQAYERWFGRAAAEVVGKTQQEILGPHYDQVRAHVERALQGETVQYETSVPTPTGMLHALVTLVPDRDESGEIRGHFTVVTDVTGRKQAEEALREEEARARTLLETLDAGVTVHATDTRIVSANPAACRILGLAEDQLRGKAVVDAAWQLVEENGSPLAASRYPVHEVLSTGTAIRGMVVGVRKPDQTETTWIIVSARPQCDPTGAISEVVVSFVDVSERVRAQRQLRLLQAAVERLNDMVVITEFREDGQGAGQRIVYANSAFQRLTGYALPELVGRSPGFLQGPETDWSEVRRVNEAVRLCQPVRSELLNYTREGKPYWVDLDLMPLVEPGGRVTHMVAVQRDITARRAAEARREELEAQLRASQKLEAVGTLASGIAHDFNNIVAGILGNVALAQDSLGDQDSIQLHLQQIKQAGVRARDLVRQILAFSRRAPTERKAVDLREVLDETLTLVRTGIPPGVRLQVLRPPSAVWVQGNATQLQQILMNLCVNAWQSLAQYGGEVDVGLRVQGDRACLWVRDTGCGMDDAVLQRIFDPFFTTKGPGGGTGLGLAVVHGIVQAHGGRIDVHSVRGAGSTFEVVLPLASAPSDADRAKSSTPPRCPGRGELVLVVDDDDTLREVLPRLLQQAGWRTEACAGARQALERLAGPGERPALLLTDLNMPDIGGLELCQRVASDHPDVRRVLISGHASESVMAAAAAAGVSAVLAKEDLLDTLVPGVADILNKGCAHS